MGDSVHLPYSGDKLARKAITAKQLSRRCLLAPTPKSLPHKAFKCIASMKQGVLKSGIAGDVGLFLLKTAALDLVRRFSSAKCPFIWSGFQALQILCYPPFKWIQKWAPFKYLVKYMKTLSQPLLFLTIATVFSDQSSFTKEASGHFNNSQTYSESQSERSVQPSASGKSPSSEVPINPASEKWLLQLYVELEKQGISLPERLNEDELRRFYGAANCEFSRFLSSVKKTIHWRQTYTILSPRELETWSHFVYWHGCDVMLRPCLIIRLGLACSQLRSQDRPLFVKAVVSQIEHGVTHMVNLENPQITVMMDCAGLSPFGFPMAMMRSCAILLQDHYPNRLACLIIVRLPPVARVITQTLFQVLRPATRKKLKIIGGNYQNVLLEYLPKLPNFLGGGGGDCASSKCSEPVVVNSDEHDRVKNEQEIIIEPQQQQRRPVVEHVSADEKDDDIISPPGLSTSRAEADLNRSRNRMRGAIIGLIMWWIFIVVVMVVYHPEYYVPPLLYYYRGS